MDGWIWSMLAVALLGVIVRVSTSQPRGNWKGRGLLLVSAIGVCVLVYFAVDDAVLMAAEESASTGQPMRETAATWIGRRFDLILFPVYVAIVGVVIDLLARLLVRVLGSNALAASAGRSTALAACANLIVFVAAPGMLYAAASQVTQSSSIMNDAVGDAVMPIVATYGAPAYWLSECLGVCRSHRTVGRLAPWAWNPGYRSGPRISRPDFLRDAAPWFTLSILLACIATLRRDLRARQPITFSGYFLQAGDPASGAYFKRFLRGPWRARVLLVFTCVAGMTLLAAISFVMFVAYLPYIVIGGPLLIAGLLALRLAFSRSK